MSEVHNDAEHPTKSALSMWAIGVKKSQYSSDFEPPITLVQHRATAESLRALLEAGDTRGVYIIEIPLWPDLRKED